MKTNRIAAGIILAASVSLTACANGHTASACEPVRDGTVSEAHWSALLASGWHGERGDGMEALYAPTCESA